MLQNGKTIPPVNWRTAKCRDLLAFMLHQEQPVGKDMILEHLWPEYDPERAQSNFHTTLYYLRKHLEQMAVPDLIVYQNTLYRLRAEDIYNDHRHFQDLVTVAHEWELKAEKACKYLERALSLYRGDYLEELDYHWLLPRREKLRSLYCEALLKVARYYLEKASYRQAIVHLENLVKIEPYFEEPYRLMMTAYAGLGNWGSMAKIYRHLTHILGGELGIAPATETQELYKKLGRAGETPRGRLH